MVGWWMLYPDTSPGGSPSPPVRPMLSLWVFHFCTATWYLSTEIVGHGFLQKSLNLQYNIVILFVSPVTGLYYLEW